MDEFDDPVLRDALRRAAGDPGDERAAFQRVVAAADRARRRRRIAVAGGWAAAAVVGVAGVALVTRGGEERITPATIPTTVATPTIGPTTTQVPITTMRRPSTTAAPTVTRATATTTATTVPGMPPPTAAPATDPPSHPTYPPTTMRPPPTDPSPPTSGTETFSSGGGSIEVRLADGVLSLAPAPSPANGYLYRIEDDGPDRVRVRFCGPDDSYRITVTAPGGEMVGEVEPGSSTGSCGG